MKISDLIRKLQILEKSHGDNNLTFSVSDSFSTGFGESMELTLEVGDGTSGVKWFGSSTVENWTNISFSLTPQKGKNSKISYRKQ